VNCELRTGEPVKRDLLMQTFAANCSVGKQRTVNWSTVADLGGALLTKLLKRVLKT